MHTLFLIPHGCSPCCLPLFCPWTLKLIDHFGYLEPWSIDAHNKMLDLVMNTMSNVTEKLGAMDLWITGLALRLKVTPAKSTTR